MENKKEVARRYNKGKLRYELIPPYALEKLAEVYTRGAHKYSDYKNQAGEIVKGADIPLDKVHEYELVYDASPNWREGLPWMDTIGSVKRHIEAWTKGEDVDEELGTLHLANAAWGLFALMEYYNIYPEGDNRWKNLNNNENKET